MVRGALTGDFRDFTTSNAPQSSGEIVTKVPATSSAPKPVANSLLKSPAPKVVKQSPVRDVSESSESDVDLPLRKSRRLNPADPPPKQKSKDIARSKPKRVVSPLVRRVKKKRRVAAIARAAPKRQN